MSPPLTGTINVNAAGLSIAGAIEGAGVVNVKEDFTAGGSIAVKTLTIASGKMLTMGHDIGNDDQETTFLPEHTDLLTVQST